jgi:hypothetical protein
MNIGYDLDNDKIKFDLQKNFSSNEKINLEDLGILIVVKIDSEERLSNLEKCVENLNHFFENTIHIYEQGQESKIHFNGNYNKVFFESEAQNFNRNKLTNNFINEQDFKFVLIVECDVLLDPKAIIQTYAKLISEEFYFAFPYNGFYSFLSQDISKDFDPKISVPNMWKYAYNFDNSFITEDYELSKKVKHTGFAYMYNVEKFKMCGMENENFSHWGWDDVEKFVRIRILGYEIYYSDYFCYHLWHPRPSKTNKFYSGKEIGLKELHRIMAKSKEQLLEEIKTWKWIK